MLSCHHVKLTCSTDIKIRWEGLSGIVHSRGLRKRVDGCVF
jgi:hypothetical protein